MNKIFLLISTALLLILACNNSTPKVASYEVIKTKILNDSTFSSLPEAEQVVFSDTLIYKLKNDADFNSYARNMETMLTARLDSTKSKSDDTKTTLILAIRRMGTKFPELRKLDKVTRKMIMEQAGDTIARDVKRRFSESLLKKSRIEQPTQ